mgnify:CR=1 FL=1
MNKKEKKIIYFKKKFKKKINSNSKLFVDLDIDSFEFAKIVIDLEKFLRKKYSPSLIEDFSKLTVEKFSKLSPRRRPHWAVTVSRKISVSSVSAPILSICDMTAPTRSPPFGWERSVPLSLHTEYLSTSAR